MPTRRQLLGWSALGAGALAGRQLVGGTPPRPAPVGDWLGVRAQFAFAQAAQPRIPMNAANLAPPSRAVEEALAAATQRLDLDVSFHHRLLFLGEERSGARALLARQLGVGADDIALPRNTSEANAIVVNGLELAPDDEVVLWEQNHDTNYRSWSYRSERRPFRCVSVSVPPQPRSAQELIDAFVSKLTPKTRVVAFTQVSNITGLRLPAAELCRAIHAHRRDIFVHVDGAQSWGAVELDLARLGCDSFSASAHKWLCGPRELGLLYVRREWAERLRPTTIGYDWRFDYPEDALPAGAARFDCLGQRNDAQYPALSAALRFQDAVGIGRIEARVAELGQRLRRRLDAAGLRLVTPQDDRFAHGVVVVVPKDPGRAIAAFRELYERHGLYGAFVHGNRILGDGEAPKDAKDLHVRLCPHVYNTEDDVERAAAALA